MVVIDLKMCRFDNVPWGFRLVGGADFDYPLTVVKVNEGSIAEAAGLHEGDIIVRINDIPTTPLPHEEVNKLILGCGNVFFFGIHRDNIEDENETLRFPCNEYERPISPYPEYEYARQESQCPIYETNLKDYIEENLKYENSLDNLQQNELLEMNEERSNSVLSENTEVKLVEEEIAAVLSSETEVLKEHAVLGIFPKPGVCMSSDVLRTLNDEATKTKAEKDQENRKWTTFLQRPDRPVPKSKQQLEAEQHAANKYQIKIIKNAPRTPERMLSPPLPTIEEKSKEPTPEKLTTPIEPEIEEPPPTDSEVPNLVEDDNAKIIENELNIDEKLDKEKDINVEIDEEIKQDNISVEEKIESETATTTTTTSSTSIETIVEKTEEELALERQLADVQKQLAALSTLPSTIQATLDAVTKQLADLLPTLKLQEQQQQSLPNENNLEKIDESIEEINELENEETADKIALIGNNNEKSINDDNDDDDDGVVRNNNNINETDDVIDEIDIIKQQETLQRKEETRQMEEELNIKKQKRSDVIEELEEHLERQKNPKRSKRAFGPLTPSSERPLVLPGGRRWYRPKDAYNDEFIAETLSAQAELITGTTLGVNFMKYQKPEKKIDLNRSEVYKIIHHLDRQPVRGIEIRPPVVAAEADIRNAVTS